MQYHGSSYAEDVWDVFRYEKNIQGDIVAVYNDAGTKLVTYYYDAFGYCIASYDNNGSSTRAYYNPFRYRGYYYDKDLDLYYLNARYYDGRTGRFISPDDALYHTLQGYNLYAYCNNNPVNYYDPTGRSAASVFWSWLTGAGAIATGEPTIIGEAFLLAGIIVIGGICLGERIYQGITIIASLAEEATDEVPQSIEAPDGEIELDEKGRPVVRPGQIPSEKDGYIAPKNGPSKGKSKDGKWGWKDKNGNIWVPAPTNSPLGHGGHWDVQSPNGGYTNVYPGGTIRGGKLPLPKIPIL